MDGTEPATDAAAAAAMGSGVADSSNGPVSGSDPAASNDRKLEKLCGLMCENQHSALLRKLEKADPGCARFVRRVAAASKGELPWHE